MAFTPPPPTFVCAREQTGALALRMHASTHKEFLLVHSQKRLDAAVFSSVEIGTIPSPVNNSLTSAHAAVIAAELERFFFNWPSCWKAIAGFDNLWLHLRGFGAKVGGRNGWLMTEIIEQFLITSCGVEKWFLSLTPKGILIPSSPAAVVLSRFWNPGCSVEFTFVPCWKLENN